MKKITVIGFIILTLNSFAQIDSLSIEFHPSFLKSSSLNIGFKGDAYLMTLKSEDFTEMVNLKKSIINEFEIFFDDYKFMHKSSIDTVGKDFIIENGDTVIYYHVMIGNDGIDIYGNLTKKGITKTFKFWSPDKENINYRLIEILFNLMNNNFINQETINYLELLEQYFDFGLGLKKIKNTPLTYKLYGMITINEVEELYDFFESLPTDKKVFIDMSNFMGMGTIFDEDFLELSKTHKLVSWINCSVAAKIALKRAGVKRRRYN